jgi:hypothetical protein
VTGRALALAVAVLALAASTLPACGEEKGAGRPAASAERCGELAADEARACYIDVFTRRLAPKRDPRPRLDAITDEAWEAGGFLLANCHGIMHTVARRYARERGVALETLMDYLPRSNDPGCPAGFAHGLVTAVAPNVDVSEPRAAAAVCAETDTRYQRYSCTHGFGHAFMRISGGELEPALALCRALGRDAPDCAQGAFHDYWFAVAGFDDAPQPADLVTDPRRLCAAQAREFVRPCWYRAYVDFRPAGVTIETSADLDRLCAGLRALQREACLTAAAVIGPPDPRAQLDLCIGFAGRDAVGCIRGTKVQNLLREPDATRDELIARCDLFTGATRLACYRWLGKTLAVVTDGAFARTGCARLAPDARRACLAGARSAHEPLVTFS